MKKKVVWIYYRTRWFFNNIYIKYMHKNILNNRVKYGINKMVPDDISNNRIKKIIEDNIPFACCRFGLSEIGYLVKNEKDMVWGTNCVRKDDEINSIFQMFPNDNGAGSNEFMRIMRNSCKTADMLAVWPFCFMGDHYVSMIKNIEKTMITSALVVEPYYFEKPWSMSLKGKKVLVIHPFTETIEEQYKKHREVLFENKDILPEFELTTLKSIWFDTSGKDKRFSNWFEVYDYLFNEAMKKDFDIALIGCGTFGFPLATRIKQVGKQAIHMGGALQLLFGIKGQRWEEHELSKLYNQYWVRPEKPELELDFEKIDNACYW